MNPNENKGGATPPPTPATETPPPATPPPPTSVQLPGEEYKSLLDKAAKLAEVEARAAREAEEREAARIKALADKGLAEQALAEQRAAFEKSLTEERARTERLEGQILNSTREAQVTAAITEAMSGRTFVSPSAAAQVRREIEAKLEVTRDASGQVVVREKGSLRPVAEAVKAMLATGADEFSHCIKSATTGGTGGGGGGTPPPAVEQNTPVVIPSHLAGRGPATERGYGLRATVPSSN